MTNTNKIQKDAGKNIKTLRINTGYSQKDLSQISGVSVNTISRIENGADCSFSQIIKIFTALNKEKQLIDSFQYYATSITENSKSKKRVRKSSAKNKQAKKFKWGDEN